MKGYAGRYLPEMALPASIAARRRCCGRIMSSLGAKAALPRLRTSKRSACLVTARRARGDDVGKLKWYKRDPDAALGGMMGLTLEERGAYGTALDLIYSHADQLPDDDRFIAGWCGCDVRVWRRIRAKLMSLGKLSTDEGFLRNGRATSEVDEALHRVELATNAAFIKHGKSPRELSKNNRLGYASARNGHDTPTTTPTIMNHERGASRDVSDARAALGDTLKALAQRSARRMP